MNNPQFINYGMYLVLLTTCDFQKTHNNQEITTNTTFYVREIVEVQIFLLLFMNLNMFFSLSS
jgi:hypothetical protein